MNYFLTPLHGKLLNLIPLHEGHRQDLFRAAADPLIWEQHPQKDRFKREVFDQFFDNLLKCEGTLVAVDSESREFIGSSSYYDYDKDDQVVTIGFSFLIRRCWGHTYNREMKQLMVDHAFKKVGRILFHVDEDNVRSQMALRKIGAIEQRRSERKLPSGAAYKTIVFQLYKPTR